MADHDPAYVDTLARQLCTHHTDLLSAESDLSNHRRRLAIVVRVLHNPAIALDIRQNLAHDLGLPEPTQ